MTTGRRGNDNWGGCFDVDSIVWTKLPNGEIRPKKIGEVKVGDSVESVDPKTGQPTFSKVCFIQHDDDKNPFKLILNIEYQKEEGNIGALRITPNHLVYVSKGKDLPSRQPLKNPLCASKIEIGDYLWVKSSEEFSPCRVISVHKEDNVRIINPITMNHHIVVSGVHASIHVDNEKLFRFITSPLRAFYAVKPQICTSKPLKAFNRMFYRSDRNQVPVASEA